MSLLTALLVSVGINIVMFVPAYLLRTDKLTDISYSFTFVVVALAGLLTGGITFPSVLLSLMIFVWAARLGGYLLTRIRKIGKDSRFDAMRESFLKFLGFWLLQGFTVWVVLLPSTMFFEAAPRVVSGWAAIGVVVWAAGFLIEAVADIQKYRFINEPANAGKWIESGLWRYSRHPNYFGEISLWAGIYLYAAGGLGVLQGVVGVVSPLYIALLIIFVSGIPLLEKAAERRWGENPDYLAYRGRTSVLVPWFVKRP